MSRGGQSLVATEIWFLYLSSLLLTCNIFHHHNILTCIYDLVGIN